jgi:hypothetical protein
MLRTKLLHTLSKFIPYTSIHILIQEFIWVYRYRFKHTIKLRNTHNFINIIFMSLNTIQTYGVDEQALFLLVYTQTIQTYGGQCLSPFIFGLIRQSGILLMFLFSVREEVLGHFWRHLNLVYKDFESRGRHFFHRE